MSPSDPSPWTGFWESLLALGTAVGAALGAIVRGRWRAGEIVLLRRRVTDVEEEQETLGKDQTQTAINLGKVETALTGLDKRLSRIEDKLDDVLIRRAT